MQAPEAMLRRLDVSDADLIAETGAARVWRVLRADGTPAVLKHWPEGMKNEAMGPSWMAAKTALSIAWRTKGEALVTDPECDLLEFLLHVART